MIEHKEKIKKVGKLSEDGFLELYGLVLRNVRTIHHSIIPKEFYQSAIKICKDIDADDIPFIATNDYVRGRLWTGDVKLVKGLSSKGYKKIVVTSDLFSDFIQKENKK